jgi:peptidoglycan/LPS O-acetylase OafA/YrhL
MSIRYRPEVDGLRAISVVAIIIYHAEFMRAGYNLIPGAFLAVEVFFVISGFLITSLILKELQESRGFSVRNFYERRVRRLFPALLLVLTVSAIGAWFILLPAQLVDFAYSLVASLFFVSNFYWDLSLQEYGAESGLLKPLLHTWTLAVEEQFYIVFPFMLVGMYKWFKHWLVWLLLGVFLVSLCFAHWHTGVNLHSSFYMLSSRYSCCHDTPASCV